MPKVVAAWERASFVLAARHRCLGHRARLRSAQFVDHDELLPSRLVAALRCCGVPPLGLTWERLPAQVAEIGVKRAEVVVWLDGVVDGLRREGQAAVAAVGEFGDVPTFRGVKASVALAREEFVAG